MTTLPPIVISSSPHDPRRSSGASAPPRARPGTEPGRLALRPDEQLDLGVGLGLPPAAMKDPIMADFELEVVGLFCWRDAAAEIVCCDGLAGAAHIVALTFD